MATVVHPAHGALARPTAIAGVLNTFRMEGLEPDAETVALLAQYEAGSLSLDEFGSAIERHVAQMGSAEVAGGAA